ncbi:MAG: hypothetical protein V3V06_02935 [Dehalococcoidia bacterium]
MEKRVEFAELREHVRQHNELAAKYRLQIEGLRQQAAEQMDIWEVLLQQMFLQCSGDASSDGAVPEEVLQAAMDFGFQCMGVGAVLALDGLAQETIVI